VRQGNVYYKKTLAGTITETVEGDSVFTYDATYAETHPKAFITFSMPVRKAPYTNNVCFLFLKD
jgi:serine/threonine-protein kinase HipA